jgi:hypothetical protein
VLARTRGIDVSLDFEFAPIDVRIEGHPKAWRAGPEAMGLWLWGMVHARQHKTGGVLDRASVLGAWGGKRNAALAKKLEAAGLWIVRDDGGWDIHNFDSKTAGRSKSTERVKRFRERSRNVSETRSTETSASLSVSVSSSVSSPDLASTPPTWFPTALDVIEMQTGERLPAGEAWLRYSGHRAGTDKVMSQPDAQYWLTTVMVREAKAAREEASRRGERDAKFDRERRYAKQGPEPPPKLTKAQSEAFAEELAARMGLKAKVGS